MPKPLRRSAGGYQLLLKLILTLICSGLLSPPAPSYASPASFSKKKSRSLAAKKHCLKQLFRLCPQPQHASKPPQPSPSKKPPASSERLSCFQEKLSQLPGCSRLTHSFLGRYEQRLAAQQGSRLPLTTRFLMIAAGLLLACCLGGMAVIPALLRKANYQAWRGLIPFYNLYLLHRLAGVPWWWALANLSPAIIYFWPQTCLALAESFGQERRLGFSMALLPFIYLPILAYSSDIYYEGRGHLPTIAFDLPL